MGQRVRVFNEQGIEAFRDHLHSLHSTRREMPPKELLTDSSLSEELKDSREVEPISFVSRIEAARYLGDVLAGVEKSVVEQNVGLWSWLSLFFFDQVCPRDSAGTRTPGMDYRHILEKTWRYGHRHLLAGPYQVYQLYGEEAGLLLCTPVHRENRFHHQLAGRQNFISNAGIIEAATLLYFDKAKGKPKFAAQSDNKPGALHRFVDVIQQLDLTYDLYGMSAKELLEMLPPEFDKWKKG